MAATWSSTARPTRESMDATTVFDNESIWVFEQICETLYTVTPDGKSVVP